MREKKITVTILFLLTIFLFSGCAKKAVKESEIGATGKEEALTLPSEKEMKVEGLEKGEVGEGKIGKEAIGAKERGVSEGETTGEAIEEKGVSAEIGEALKGLEEGKGGLPGGAEEGSEMAAMPQEEGLKGPSYEGLTEEEREAIKEVEKVVKEEGKLLPVYFDFDKYSLREDARETLKKNALWLKAHNNVKILIEGYADERGSNEYNLALGDKRAKSVLNYLRDLGVDVEMSTISYGEERPVCFEHNESCWWRNRRAEFRIVSDGAK